MEMSDLHIFTTNFDSDPERNRYLRDSCAHFGVTLGSFGFGTPWPGYIAGKITAAIPYLAARTEKYVLFSDGGDTMMLRNPSCGLMTAFHSFESPIVISAERDCFPLQYLAPKFPPAESGYTFPNAGGFMGERKAVIDALLFLEHNYDDGEDQARWLRLGVDNPASIKIDHWCRIFQTMSGGAGGDVRFDGGACLNQRTGTHPYFLHFNGRCSGIEEAYQRCCG